MTLEELLGKLQSKGLVRTFKLIQIAPDLTTTVEYLEYLATIEGIDLDHVRAWADHIGAAELALRMLERTNPDAGRVARRRHTRGEAKRVFLDAGDVAGYLRALVAADLIEDAERHAEATGHWGLFLDLVLELAPEQALCIARRRRDPRVWARIVESGRISDPAQLHEALLGAVPSPGSATVLDDGVARMARAGDPEAALGVLAEARAAGIDLTLTGRSIVETALEGWLPRLGDDPELAARARALVDALAERCGDAPSARPLHLQILAALLDTAEAEKRVKEVEGTTRWVEHPDHCLVWAEGLSCDCDHDDRLREIDQRARAIRGALDARLRMASELGHQLGEVTPRLLDVHLRVGAHDRAETAAERLEQWATLRDVYLRRGNVDAAVAVARERGDVRGALRMLLEHGRVEDAVRLAGDEAAGQTLAELLAPAVRRWLHEGKLDLASAAARALGEDEALLRVHAARGEAGPLAEVADRANLQRLALELLTTSGQLAEASSFARTRGLLPVWCEVLVERARTTPDSRRALEQWMWWVHEQAPRTSDERTLVASRLRAYFHGADLPLDVAWLETAEGNLATAIELYKSNLPHHEPDRRWLTVADLAARAGQHDLRIRILERTLQFHRGKRHEAQRIDAEAALDRARIEAAAASPEMAEKLIRQAEEGHDFSAARRLALAAGAPARAALFQALSGDLEGALDAAPAGESDSVVSFALNRYFDSDCHADALRVALRFGRGHGLLMRYECRRDHARALAVALALGPEQAASSIASCAAALGEADIAFSAAMQVRRADQYGVREVLALLEERGELTRARELATQHGMADRVACYERLMSRL